MKKLVGFAKSMRFEMVSAELIFWSSIRNRQLCGLKFRRQVIIGKYIVDFVCYEKHLIVELDGDQHYQQRNYDAQRSLFLESCGFRVVRILNQDIYENLHCVLEDVLDIANGAAARAL